MKHPNDRYFLVKVRYLGFRYHGWQTQPGVKTVQGMIEKTLRFILEDDPFKVLGASRTDAMVSSNLMAFQLILRTDLVLDHFLNQLRENLPPDIQALSIEAIPDDFNIIQNVSSKTYTYFFTCDASMHPFCAPFMMKSKESLVIEHMIKTATVFEGEHDFSCFCERSEADKSYRRSVDICRIDINDKLTGSFFPEESYVLEITAKGFLRYQIRYIMGALLEVGAGRLLPETIIKALKIGGDKPLNPKAPASGLILQDIAF